MITIPTTALAIALGLSGFAAKPLPQEGTVSAKQYSAYGSEEVVRGETLYFRGPGAASYTTTIGVTPDNGTPGSIRGYRTIFIDGTSKKTTVYQTQRKPSFSPDGSKLYFNLYEVRVRPINREMGIGTLHEYRRLLSRKTQNALIAIQPYFYDEKGG